MRLSAIVPTLVALGLAGSAQAGGFFVAEFGTPSSGTASAGQEAKALDASTATQNPAGMTNLDSHTLQLGAQPGLTLIQFNPAGDSPIPGGNGGNQGSFVPIMGSNYVHKLSDRWRVGFGMLSVAGAAVDPEDDWVGRNETTKVALTTLNFVPSLAVRLTDWLSVGGAPVFSYGRLDFELRLPVGKQPKAEIKRADDWAYGYIGSVMLHPTDNFRLGLLYQSEITYRLDGDTKGPLGFNPNIDLTFKLAPAARAALFWQIWDDFALLASGGWEKWSNAGNLPTSTAGVSAAVPLGMKDTWYAALGGHLKVCDKVTLQTGFRWDSAAMSTRTRTTAFPIDNQLRLAGGVLYDWSEHTQLGASLEYAWFGNARIDDAFVKGDYGRYEAWFVGLTVNWKKLPWDGMASFGSH
jgi:long-chain fatty acid transport protein